MLALERAFEDRLNSAQSPTPEPRDQQIRLDAAAELSANGHEMADERLALPKTSRRRDKRHLRFVSTQPCVVCGRTPSDAHHLRFAEPRALGCKVSDEFTVPLCRSHHRALHEAGATNAPGGTTPPLTRCPSPGTFGVSAVDQQRLNAPRPQIAQETAMPRSRKLPHCRRRTLPNRLKAEIILRQDGCCTDCGTRLIIGNLSSTTALPWRCAMCVLMPITPNF